MRWIHPQPRDTELASIYTEHYFLGDPTPESAARVQELKRRTAEIYLEVLCRRMPGGRLLEIGCGQGSFLVQARTNGFEVHGIEVSPHSVAVANQRLGGPLVRAGTIEEVPFQEGSFDAVVFFDVLEHVRDPRGFLGRVRQMLQPRGTLLLVTPALDSLSSRLLGRHWMEYKTEHLFYFSGRSIRLLLAQAGFENVQVASNKKILSLDYVERHFRRFRVPILSGLLRIGRRLLPDALAHRPVRVPASSLLVTADNPGRG